LHTLSEVVLVMVSPVEALSFARLYTSLASLGA
jgi:hypothetical protein